jgi:hypothetical protein
MEPLALPLRSRAAVLERRLVLDATLLLALTSVILDLGPRAGFFPCTMPLATFSTGVTLAVALAGFTGSVATRGFNPINYMYWFYHAFVFMVPTLLQVWRQQFPWAGTYRPDEIVFSNMLVSISMASYALAYSRVPQRDRAGRELRPIWQVLAAVSVVNALAAGASVALAGSALFAPRGSVSEFERGGNEDLLLTGAKFAVFAGSLATVGLWRLHRQSGEPRRGLVLRVMLAAVAAAICLNNPIANARYVFMGVTVGFFFIFTQIHTVSAKAALGAVTVSALYLAFGAVKHLATQGWSGDLNVGDYLMRVDFDGFQQTINVVRMVDATGVGYAKNFLGAALFFVPRALWAAKPHPLGMLAADAAGYAYDNLASPYVSEGYYALGLPGVLLFSYALGALACYLDGAAERARQSGLDSWQSVLAVYLSGFVVILMRGSINGVFPGIGVGLLALLGVFIASRAMVRRNHWALPAPAREPD